MEIILFVLGGFISHFTYLLWNDITHKTIGIIDVDHTNETCKLHITSNDLKNRRIKKVVFKVNHNVEFSREEQGL